MSGAGNENMEITSNSLCLYRLEDGSIECRECTELTPGELIGSAPNGVEPGIYQEGDPEIEVEKGPEV